MIHPWLTLGLVLGLILAATPFLYYLIAIFSAWRYFRQPRPPINRGFTPPVSNLKPIRGLDPDAYDNLASFCRQDYPDYELLLCVDPSDDAVHSVIERLRRDFPERAIRVLYGAGRIAANDKVAKLVRLVNEASHEVVVISDSDVRVKPDYLRSVVSPLSDPKVGAVTCFYAPTEAGTFAERLHTIGMMSDFYAGILTAWQLDGVKFALGKTIVTTRTHLAGFGGYAALENRPADDLLVGRLIAEGGGRVELIPYCVDTVADFNSLKDLVHKRTRWLVVMRNMRPAGHFGLLFTQGLPWSLAAVALHPSIAVALAYLGTYLSLRVVLTWIIGIRGLSQRGLWRELPWIPVWDAVAFVIWVASFLRRSIRWRGADYYIRNGALVPVAPSRAGE
jgi:ceramide glucosyltransferase